MYVAGLRPTEAVALRRSDCKLPDTGWGSSFLEKSRPTVGKRWTGTGEVHDNRGLATRPANETRIVPIPPRLVRMLLAHIKEFGTAKDGRLFANERGGVVAFEVLLSRYAKCLDGRQDVANRRMAELLDDACEE